MKLELSAFHVAPKIYLQSPEVFKARLDGTDHPGLVEGSLPTAGSSELGNF